jgi:hypothetical protein
MFITVLLLPAISPSQATQDSRADSQLRRDTAEGMVTALYDLVTFGPGGMPDWSAVKSLFVPEAVIVLRTGRDSTTVLSVDGFIDDFTRFALRLTVRENGFRERIVRMKPVVFGAMASFLVLYEASIPGWERPPQQGVDAVLLRNEGGEWKIVAITNEIVTPERPPPPELSED